jgi:hypothetical protein
MSNDSLLSHAASPSRVSREDVNALQDFVHWLEGFEGFTREASEDGRPVWGDPDLTRLSITLDSATT